MSLTIFPKAFNVGFSPQYQPAKSQVQGTAGPPQVDSSGQVSGNRTELNTVKIISDDNDISSDNTGLSGSENSIIEVVNDETGKEVRQIPGEQQLRLSKGISEYQNVAFNHDRPV